jgi:hypothetical protein
MTNTVLITETTDERTVAALALVADSARPGSRILVDLSRLVLCRAGTLRAIEAADARLSRRSVEVVVIAPDDTSAGRLAGFYRLDESVLVVTDARSARLLASSRSAA